MLTLRLKVPCSPHEVGLAAAHEDVTVDDAIFSARLDLVHIELEELESTELSVKVTLAELLIEFTSDEVVLAELVDSTDGGP